MGLILAVHVHSAGIQDRDGAKPLLLLARWFGWLRVIWADGGYAGQLVTWVRALKLGRCARLEIIRKIGAGFQLLPKRWVVERTFAWLHRFRRLAVRYERRPCVHEAFLTLACSLV